MPTIRNAELLTAETYGLGCVQKYLLYDRHRKLQSNCLGRNLWANETDFTWF